MKLNRRYKYRLYPNKSQIEVLNRTLDTCRYLYNCALQERRDAYAKNKKNLSYYDQTKELPECKKYNDELNLIYGQVLYDVLNRLDKAYRNYFRHIRNNEKKGYPRFKSKDRYNSFTYSQLGFSISHGKLHLSKIGDIKIHLSRPLDGKIKQVSIKKSSTGKWYAYFLIEIKKEIEKREIVNTIGIDMGLTSFLTTSDGEKIDNPHILKASENKLVKEQRQLSAKTKGSNNRRKQKLKVAKVYERIVNQRLDFQHKLSKQFVQKYDMISHEDLNVKGMVKNHKLAKSISDASWGQFLAMLLYKAEEAGVTVVGVDPKNTSQRCSDCGEIVHKGLSKRTHKCACGLELDRDVNAAKNILSLGLREALPEFTLVESGLKMLGETRNFTIKLDSAKLEFC